MIERGNIRSSIQHKLPHKLQIKSIFPYYKQMHLGLHEMHKLEHNYGLNHNNAEHCSS